MRFGCLVKFKIRTDIIGLIIYILTSCSNGKFMCRSKPKTHSVIVLYLTPVSMGSPGQQSGQNKGDPTCMDYGKTRGY